MNPIKNLLMYTVFAGGGSVGLGYYFIDEYFLPFAIGGLIVFSLLATVYEFITDKRKFSLNFEGVNRGPESEYAAEGNQLSVVYYTVGVIIFGSIILLL